MVGTSSNYVSWLALVTCNMNSQTIPQQLLGRDTARGCISTTRDTTTPQHHYATTPGNIKEADRESVLRAGVYMV